MLDNLQDNTTSIQTQGGLLFAFELLARLAQSVGMMKPCFLLDLSEISELTPQSNSNIAMLAIKKQRDKAKDLASTCPLDSCGLYRFDTKPPLP
jgi:hypothetical protein